MNTKNPTFEGRMVPRLKSLAGKLLEKERFGSLAKVSDILAGLSGDGWSRLSEEDKEYYLKKMSTDFHPRGPIGDSDLGWDEDYQAILELITYEEKGLKKK